MSPSSALTGHEDLPLLLLNCTPRVGSCGSAPLPGQRMGALVARKHLAPHLNSPGSWGERDMDDALSGSWRLNPNQPGAVQLQMAKCSEGTGPLTQTDDQDERGRLLSSILRAQTCSPGESLTWTGPLHTQCGHWNSSAGGWRGGWVQFYTACPQELLYLQQGSRKEKPMT